jgi:hypothetical protein
VPTKEIRQEDFLARAKEAEEMAKRANDRNARDSWLKIAQSYRNLAVANGAKL